MSEIIEHRCSCCGHIYKHKNYHSYIALCPNCKMDGFYQPYYSEDGIMPCRIFLGEENIGKMISISTTSSKIVSDKFGINECIDNSPDPYVEAKDMICYMLREPNKVAHLKERLKRKLIRENPYISDNLNIVVVQAIVEVMKRVYDKEMENTQKSLEKTLFPIATDTSNVLRYESEKEHYKRLLKKIEKHRYAEGKKLEELGGIFPDEYKSLKKECDNTKSNFESNNYNISIQNDHEIRTFDKLEIIDAILKKRISSVKKISNSKFIELYKEYDNYYASLIDSIKDSPDSSDRFLLVFFDLFNFEDKYSLEWIYNFADYAVKNNVTDNVFDRAKWLYVSHINIQKLKCCMMNRSFFLKEKFLTLFLDCNEDEFTKRLKEYVSDVKLVLALKKEVIKDDMLKKIPKSDWVDFIKDNYNIFGIFKRDKNWNPKKKIITARNVFKKWGTT